MDDSLTPHDDFVKHPNTGSGGISVPAPDVFSVIYTKQGTHKRLDPDYRNRQIEQFAAISNAFVKLGFGKWGKNPTDEAWQHNPLTAAQVKNTQGNIGWMLGKRGNNLVTLDIDERNAGFLAKFPHLKKTLIVRRKNAPDRAKYIFRITDQLPRSGAWKRDPKQKGYSAEILSTGRQAVIIGIHESGAVIENNGKAPMELTFADLSAIWREHTGLELRNPTLTTDTTRTEQSKRLGAVNAGTSDNPYAEEIKRHWDCMKVFAHFGRADNVVTEGAETHLRGYGGLFVNEADDSWFCFADWAGGDCVNAWAYCSSGHIGKLTGAPFIKTINEMRAAAGLPLIKRRSSGIDWDALINHYSQPEALQKPQDRSVMCSLLGVMKMTDKPIVKFSVRQAGELSGMADKTANKALRRLINDLGLLKVAQGESWFSGDLYDESDKHLRNQFDARSYTLTSNAFVGVSQLSKSTTVLSSCFNASPDQAVRADSQGRLPCTVVNSDTCSDAPKAGLEIDHSLDVHTVTEYVDNDFFQRGARITDIADVAIGGRAALDFIAALVKCNDQTAAELSESTKRARSSMAEKGKALALIGLVEIYKQGRTNYYYLVDNWRDILERYIAALTTLGRTIKRKIYHLQKRLKRASTALNGAESGALCCAIDELIKGWGARLVALQKQLSALLALRSTVFEG